ncbi:hypothetical protein MRB53_022134 [Persea americana]|uniref:Uncharacterized protein n=1 Tax=Persea americana TaxID=3435 RepID=A0ACC2L5N1_PERAE|nr:hypothetical protein MRB53_022134 [Persea americana]
MIPHNKFSFAKIWLLAAQFEIRQKYLEAAWLILGHAIGMAPKHKMFNKYMEIELRLGNIDCCRALKSAVDSEDGTPAGYEEYYDYIFPDEAAAGSPTLKILEAAYEWKN